MTEAAMNALPAAAPAPRLGSEPVMLHCDNCGAPLTDSPDGRCRYCGRDVVAPQIVMVQTGRPDGVVGVGSVAASVTGSVAGTLARTLLDVLLDRPF